MGYKRNAEMRKRKKDSSRSIMADIVLRFTLTKRKVFGVDVPLAKLMLKAVARIIRNSRIVLLDGAIRTPHAVKVVTISCMISGGTCFNRGVG